MSLYNQLMGVDQNAPIILRLIGVALNDIPRFRDASIITVDGEPRMVILTRTGGGNREAYEAQNQQLRELPGFIRDYDCPEDTTFALFEYAPVNGTTRDLVRGIAAVTPDQRTPLQRFLALIDRLVDPAHAADPDVVRATEVGQRIVDAINNPPANGIIEV